MPRITDIAGQHQDIASLSVILSVIAGATDTIGFLGLNGLFTAHITGNLVVLAAHLVTNGQADFSYILAVPVFMLVLLLTCLLAGALERAGFSTLKPLLLLQFLLLVVFLVLGVTAGPWKSAPNPSIATVTGMFGVAAMAVQNALLKISLKGAPSTAVMTTNLTQFILDVGAVLTMSDPANITQARDRAKRTFPVIIGFAIGCGLGAGCEAAVGFWSLALPVGLALLAFVKAERSKWPG